MYHRRGVHVLLSVSMLIGFSLAGAALLYVVLSDYSDTATHSTACVVSDVSLYKTGPGLGYFMGTLHNLGSVPMDSMALSLIGKSVDDIIVRDVMVEPGQSLRIMESVRLSHDDMTGGKMILSVTFSDGSRADCTM